MLCYTEFLVDQFDASRVGKKISCEKAFFQLYVFTVLMLQFVVANQHRSVLTRSKEIQIYSEYTTRHQNPSKMCFCKPKVNFTNMPLKTLLFLVAHLEITLFNEDSVFTPSNPIFSWIYMITRSLRDLPNLYKGNEYPGRPKTPNSIKIQRDKE